MSEPPSRRPEPRVSHDFATTRWSIVFAAKAAHGEPARSALSQLCETYWLPLYAYVRRRVPDVAEAQDLTQAFFAELLEKDFVRVATPDRGRFRAFLLTAFKHFLSKQWDKERAQKRGGGRVPISLDFAAADSAARFEPASNLTAEQLYDRQWALTLLGQVMDRLQAESDQAGKARQFAELKGFLIGDHEGRTFADAARTLGTTEAAAKKAASRLRQRYRELLRAEIADTVSGPEEIEDELRNLLTLFEL